MSLIERKVRVTFKLGLGSFGTSGSDTVTLSDHRVTSKITKAGGPSMGTASLVIYGMTLSQMNKLSTLGLAITLVRRNTVTVEAGDDVAGLGTVFIGTITNAWMDGEASPDVGFHVEAHTGLIEAVAPVPASSFQGSADVATIMQGLATQMGLSFENNGVSVRLSNPYFWGSGRNQVQQCAEAAWINWIIDNGSLIIWPKGSSRNLSVPLISKDTGMIGYPAYTSKGILVRTLFNPSIGYGGTIEIKSAVLQPANGKWVVFSLDYNLDSIVPNGGWSTTIGAVRPGLGPIVQ